MSDTLDDKLKAIISPNYEWQDQVEPDIAQIKQVFISEGWVAPDGDS